MRNHFAFFYQRDSMDCGPACLKMILQHYGKRYSFEYLKRKCLPGKGGVSILSLAKVAEEFGLKANAFKLSIDQLVTSTALPAILHWGQYHYVILLKVKRNGRFKIADPANGILVISADDFKHKWLQATEEGEAVGIALTFTPLAQPGGVIENARDPRLLAHIIPLLAKYKRFFITVTLAILLASALQLLPAYFAQAIVDNGIGSKNTQLLYVLLLAQLMLLIGRLFIDFIRSRLLLFIGANISVDILSSFWSKLLRLPLSFFDSRRTGDLLQRIEDQSRIERFLTGTAISAVFAGVSLVLLSLVLINYNPVFFLIFLAVSGAYLLWYARMMIKRKALDYDRFNFSAKANSVNIQLIEGIHDIQLSNAGPHFLGHWKAAQLSLFSVNNKNLNWSQKTQIGAALLNEGRNIFITFLAAKMVINGQLSLGSMLSIQFIIGQLSSTVDQFLTFTQHAQLARLSFDRLTEVTDGDVEDPARDVELVPEAIPTGIKLVDVSFSYHPFSNDYVLRNINLVIPAGKVTAIVGSSGSGKSTLLKLILKYYNHYRGELQLETVKSRNGKMIVQSIGIKDIPSVQWYGICGAVMPDSFIFNDSIAKNIAFGEPSPDMDRIKQVCRKVNLLDFINSLPLGFSTRIGSEGDGLSDGQRQRLIIARLLYKDPAFIFLDEATNALDAENEHTVLQSLLEAFGQRTMIVVAHRLSTIRTADNIVVLKDGQIKEQGTHDELLRKRGDYYELIRHQLEMDIQV